MSQACTHLDTIRQSMPQESDKDGAVCAACVEEGSGWVHLRECLVCGEIACCDSSPMQHASKHAADTSHAIVTSMEAGERWRWCYADEAIV